MILLGIIALIGIISIIIVKLYYKDKEKDYDKERLEEFLNSSDYNSSIESHENIKAGKRTGDSKTVKNPNQVQRRRRVRKVPKESANQNANLSEAQIYANTLQNASNEDLFGDYYDGKEGVQGTRNVRKVSRRSAPIETTQANGTAALLRQRAEAAKAREKAGTPKVRKVRKVKANANAAQNVPRTPERVKEQMNKEDEVKAFQEPITKEHKETINSARQGETKVKARQVPMTKEQKEFISSESAKKLIVEDGDGAVKVVKSIKPAEDIEEIKESALIEKAEEVPEETKVEETETPEVKTEETTEKAEEVPEETKVEETTEEPEEETPETKVEETTEEPEEETPEIKVEEPEEETPETKVEETTEEPKAEEIEPAEETPEVEIEESAEVGEIEPAKGLELEEGPESDDIYHDDLHILLGQEEVKEEGPENEFVTINSDKERNAGGNDLFTDAINSIRRFRGINTKQTQFQVEEIKEEVVPEDYVHDFGNGIEEIGDTITITPIREDEIDDLAYNQPNEDVDEIYQEINEEEYNKTIDTELDEAYEEVTDETAEEDANIYTIEDYIKIEKDEEEKKAREENTKKILDLKGIDSSKFRSSKKEPVPQEQPADSAQKQLIFNQQRRDVEEVYINGTLIELKVGQTVMFMHNNETYSSRILRLKPGFVGVKYRSKKIWIKATDVKKIL